jgi:hypothetical protein
LYSVGSDVAAGCSWLPKGVEPLPDIFKNVCVYFHNIDEELKQQLARYIIAYPQLEMLFIINVMVHVVFMCKHSAARFIKIMLHGLKRVALTWFVV